MGLFGKSENEKINDKNIAFQRETNELNRAHDLDMLQRNQNFAVESFLRENAEYARRVADERAFTDPSAQVARLKAAGMNPSLVGLDGNGSSANVGSVGSIDAQGTTTPMQAPRAEFTEQQSPSMENLVLGSVDAIGRSINSYYDNQVKQAQATGLNFQNSFAMREAPYKLAESIAKMEEARERPNLTRQQARELAIKSYMAESTLADYQATQKFNAINADLTGKLLKEQALNYEANTLMTYLNGKISWERLNLDKRMQPYLVKQILSKIDVDKSFIGLNDAEQQKKIQEFVTESFRTAKADIDQKTAAAIADDIIAHYHLQGDKDRRMLDWRQNLPGVGIADDFTDWGLDKINKVPMPLILK